jgi:hypothetical protein
MVPPSITQPMKPTAASAIADDTPPQAHRPQAPPSPVGSSTAGAAAPATRPTPRTAGEESPAPGQLGTQTAPLPGTPAATKRAAPAPTATNDLEEAARRARKMALTEGLGFPADLSRRSAAAAAALALV